MRVKISITFVPDSEERLWDPDWSFVGGSQFVLVEMSQETVECAEPQGEPWALVKGTGRDHQNGRVSSCPLERDDSQVF